MRSTSNKQNKINILKLYMKCNDLHYTTGVIAFHGGIDHETQNSKSKKQKNYEVWRYWKARATGMMLERYTTMQDFYTFSKYQTKIQNN